MPRDYKSNTYRTKKPQKKLGVDSWDRVLIVIFITALALVVKHFIVAEQQKAMAVGVEAVVPDNAADPRVTAATAAVANVAKEMVAAGGLSDEELNAEPNQDPNANAKLIAEQQAKAQAEKIAAANKPPRQDSIPVEPHFDFYTILPSVEVVIPDHEIKTRIREEKIGAGDKNLKYIMQAGSFRDSPDAEKLKAKLTAIGIESRVEKAQVGEVIWYRVKVGPYSGMTSVMAIKSQLRDNGVDAVVLEFK
jgi:SPOR domain